MPVHDLSFFKDWLGFQIEGSGSYENRWFRFLSTIKGEYNLYPLGLIITGRELNSKGRFYRCLANLSKRI